MRTSTNTYMLIIALLFTSFIACSSDDDNDQPILTVDAPKNLKAEFIDNAIKLTWDLNQSNEALTYHIYSLKGNEFVLVGTTKYNYFVDVVEIGSHTYKIKASLGDLKSDFSNEVTITREKINNYRKDVETLYAIQQANQGIRCWEFSDIGTDNPTVRPYDSFKELSFEVVNNERRITELLIMSDLTNLDDIGGLTALRRLTCSAKVKELDLSLNLSLTDLDCSNNGLEKINVSKNILLEDLYLHSNNLTSIDVSNNPNLLRFNVQFNELENIDVSKNTKLEWLIFTNNKLTTIDVSKNSNLKAIDCTTNKLTSIDVSNNLELIDLSIYLNEIETIDVSKNTKLQYLSCSYLVSSLDVSNNPELEFLACGELVPYLNLVNNRKLVTLSAINEDVVIDICETTHDNSLIYPIPWKNSDNYNLVNCN